MTRGELRDARKDDRRQARRAQLLDDAVEAIRELGAGATMEQLARRGGVTKPILYRHFGDREGLIGAIAEHFAAALMEEIDRSLQAPGEPRDRLRATIDTYLAFVESEPELYRFLVHQTMARPAGIAPTSPLAEGIARRVTVVIGEQLRERGRDSGAAAPWSYGIVGMVHQAGDWWLDDRTMPRATLTEYLTGLLWDGLAAAAAEVVPRPTA